jgi:hypothetical protein
MGVCRYDDCSHARENQVCPHEAGEDCDCVITCPVCREWMGFPPLAPGVVPHAPDGDAAGVADFGAYVARLRRHAFESSGGRFDLSDVYALAAILQHDGLAPSTREMATRVVQTLSRF